MDPVTEWLKREYEPSPSYSDADAAEESEPKRVRFSDIHEAAMQQFPTLSNNKLQGSIKLAFPNHTKRRLGKERKTYIVGIQPINQSPSFLLTQSASCSHSDVPVHVHNLLSDEQAKNTMLKAQIKELEYRLSEAEGRNVQLRKEVDLLVSHQSIITNGPDTPDHLDEFSLERILAELQAKGSKLLELFNELGEVSRCSSGSSQQCSVPQTKMITSLCTLLNARSSHCNGLQILFGLLLIARSTDKQVISVLNHAGVCASYYTTWNYLLKLTCEAKYLEKVQSGHWIWIYDNLNIHHKVRHERQDVHSSMLNITSRLAVQMNNLPPWDVDWSDTRPQSSRHSLTISDILPSSYDGEILKQRAVQYTQRFLVEEFDSLGGLKYLISQDECPHPVTKGSVAPLKVVFQDEKYIDSNIAILHQFQCDANLTGSAQVFVGDQMTCKNLRGAKRWRQAEVNAIDNLSWAKEVPGDFHFVWECLKTTFDMFWGTPSLSGSFCNLREFVHRVQVDKSVKCFNVGDEFAVHVFKAHFLAKICAHFKLQSPSEYVPHAVSTQWLKSTAEKLVSSILFPPESSSTLSSFLLHTLFLYVDLRNAIKWENGEHIIRHWRWWIPRFLATGKRNYATEAVTHLVNIMAEFPKHISYIVVHNRTINTDGRPGHGKPLDQMLEHYNLIVKLALKNSGDKTSRKHIEELSMSALFLLQTSKKVYRMFEIHNQTKHTIRESRKDIQEMCKHILANQPSETTFDDPCTVGWKKLAGGWLEKVIKGDGVPEEEEDTTTSISSPPMDTDIDYELYDN